MSGHSIIVIGASAGGVEALTTLVRDLPLGLPASIFIVLHIPAQSPSLLASILSRVGHLPAVQASDGLVIQPGYIYVAPPDHHLLLEENRMRTVRGPKENRHRPAVDPLFRTAALVYGPKVVGVILTGALDDGTAGLLAVKRQGGIAIAQDPAEAFYPGMPASALENVQVDYKLKLAQIAPMLVRLANEPVDTNLSYPVSEEMQKEAKIVAMNAKELDSAQHVGTPSAYSCPECGGVLWELHDDELLRFRCRVGHAFSIESVQAEQNDAIEAALWTALKTLEEKISLSRRLAQQYRTAGNSTLAQRFEARAQETEHKAHTLQQVLLNTDHLVLPDIPPTVEQAEQAS